jgi:hypothetical protein
MWLKCFQLKDIGNTFLLDISQIGPPDYEYAIIFYPNVLFSSYVAVNIQYGRHLGSIEKKIIFWVTWRHGRVTSCAGEMKITNIF